MVLNRSLLRLVKWVVIGLIVFMTTDLCLSLAGRRPWFSIPVATYKDGGSSLYVGVFYRIYYRHSLTEMMVSGGERVVKVTVGPEYAHSFLPINFKRLKLVDGS